MILRNFFEYTFKYDGLIVFMIQLFVHQYFTVSTEVSKSKCVGVKWFDVNF